MRVTSLRLSVLIAYLALIAASQPPTPNPIITLTAGRCFSYYFSSDAVRKAVTAAHENPTNVPTEMGPVTRYYYDRGDVTMRTCTPEEATRIKVLPNASPATPHPSPS